MPVLNCLVGSTAIKDSVVCFCFFLPEIPIKNFAKVTRHKSHSMLNSNFLLPCFWSVAHPGGSKPLRGSKPPLLELKKQHNFVDINSL